VNIPGATAVAAVAAGAYALYEPYRFRIRELDVPAAPGVPPLTVLHVSDMHMKAGDRPLQRFLNELPDRLGETPDVVAVTGDLIENNGGIDPVVEALSKIEARLGRFYVLGSHDYYQAVAPSYLKYWKKERAPRRISVADHPALESGLQSKGWVSLQNRTQVIDGPHGTIRIVGVDDPYLHRQRVGHIGRAPGETFALGLMHAPDIVSEWMLKGFDLALAGHTHGGQIRLPGVGALVTNCRLPVALAMGLAQVGTGFLHVSPGLGSSMFSPVRFLCRPEVTLLRLRPATFASAGR
jgi:uncharacterized protein